MEEEMRRHLLASLIVVATLSLAQSVFAQPPPIIQREPMDVGIGQTEAVRSVGEDMLYSRHYPNYWFDFGASFPVGELEEQDWDPGLLFRFSNVFWRRGNGSLIGSAGMHFSDDAYFNEQQEELSVIGGDELSRYFIATPVTVEYQLTAAPRGAITPFAAIGPGIVWSHENLTRSAVNNGVGTADTILFIGPGGEQGISPYQITTSTHFNLGWTARLGIQLRVSDAEHPLYFRLMGSGTTYYHHSDPRTLIGVSASFGR